MGNIPDMDRIKQFLEQKKTNSAVIIGGGNIGVAPDTAFLMDSGLKFGVEGHLLDNERMQTNVESVYTVWDAVEVIDIKPTN